MVVGSFMASSVRRCYSLSHETRKHPRRRGRPRRRHARAGDQHDPLPIDDQPTDGPQLSLVVGNGPGSGVLQARFELDRIRFDTGQGPAAPVIGQAWIDEHSLRLDIIDANAEGRLVRLDARRRGGSDYRGILIYAGRTWRVRCTEEG
jgi:hypothetical protein